LTYTFRFSILGITPFRKVTRLLSNIVLTAIGHKSHLKFVEQFDAATVDVENARETAAEAVNKHRARGSKSNKISR